MKHASSIAMRESANSRSVDINKVRKALLNVQSGVATTRSKINLMTRSTKKLPLTDFEFNNIIKAFEHVNVLIKRPEIKPEDILDINNLCIYGIKLSDFSSRGDLGNNRSIWEFMGAMQYNREKFYERIGSIWQWFVRHTDISPYRLAAGLHTRIVSGPQLFVEGNHRTGSLLMAYVFAKMGIDPFHLDSDTAAEFFDISHEIKFCSKTQPIKWLKLLYQRGKLTKFLIGNFNDRS
jgi:hypothetical protein